ncbi:hypothetical protein CCICO_10245 [Corynebacterium ciconiae DSM 44920]|uniref:iron chaperone n=1 Tax=Corynebacterium ciconiae TaxID=227319 RepID=UPI00037C5E2D|nr:DUF1801 domain-containing protein [Corynebacterium ciconiae]WKD62048.1 hypothetical protein CCICO_10245 [Corynebacterium ciconiae DSM 44920]
MTANSFQDYLANLSAPAHRERLREVADWAMQRAPQLRLAMKWNQPMLLWGKTFILGFSAATRHLSVAAEPHIMAELAAELDARGADYTPNLVRLPWSQPVDYELLGMMLDRQCETKKECTTFWLPQ